MKIITAAILLVTALFGCNARSQEAEASKSPDHDFFVEMLRSAPADYAAARKTFLSQRNGVLPFLKRRSTLTDNWYEKAIADSLILAIESPEVYSKYEKAFPETGVWFTEKPPAHLTNSPLAEADGKPISFLIEKLFTELPRSIPDRTVMGSHMSRPSDAAQCILKIIGGKRAARAVAIALIAGDRSSKEVYESGKLPDNTIVEKMVILLSDQKTQPKAGWGLGELQDPRAIEPLLASLTDYSVGRCYSSAEALVRFGDEAVVPLLQVAATTPNPQIRSWAKHALGKLGPAVRKTQIISLKRNKPLSRRDAILSMSVLGGEDAVVTALAEVWPGSLTDDRSLDLLMSALVSHDVRLCLPIANALARAGDPAVPRLNEALTSSKPEVRSWAKHSLKRIETAKAKKRTEE